MQIDVLVILKELIIKYTKGESSSIKEDTAVNILNSIYYSINAYIRNPENSESDSSLVPENDIVKMYKEGLEIIEKSFKKCKALYEEIKDSKLDIPLEIYNDTIDIALPDFFKNYDIIFAAQDTTSSMDYPLAFDDMSITGIFYIKQYLEKLKIENRFCSFFSQASIRKILRNYGKKYRINIIKSPINVFEILVDQSVFVDLSGNNKKILTIFSGQFQEINKNLSGKNRNEVLSLINEAFIKMAAKFNINDLKLIDYINKYKDSFTIRFLNAYESGNLLNMIITDNENIKEDKIVFKEGKRMNNYKFCYLIDEIMKCQDIKNKLEIISSNVHALEDYIDILDSECLFGNEYTDAFKELNDMSIAVLGKTVFYDDLRCGSLELTSENLLKYENNSELEWQTYYIEFLLNLESERRKNIEKIITKIDTDAELE